MKNKHSLLILIRFVIGLSFFPLLSFAQLQPLVFVHVTVIDMTGAEAKPNMTVIVTGNHISAIGKTGNVSLPANALVIDATGKYLIPGLWDMHVHLAISDNARSFPMYIANGVTGIRDMGGDMDSIKKWRHLSATGNLLAPHIVAAGPILDGKTPGFPLRVTVDNATTGKKVVDSLKKRGVDFIKVHNLLSRDAYFAIAAEAKKQGLPFAGHVPNTITVDEASNAGQKSIEHLSGLPTAYDDLNARQLFALFAKNKTWQCPTLVTLQAIAFLNDSDFTKDTRINYISKSVKESWDFQIKTFFKSRTPDAITDAKASVQENIKQVGAMRVNGVEIIIGTDVGFPYVFPGFSLHDELALLVQAGFTPMEALQTATRNPAKYLDLLNSLGTIETGKIANLVLLDANPLEDIGNSKKIHSVVLNGKYLSKIELDRMMADVLK